MSNPTQFITLRARVPIRAGEQLTTRYKHFMHSKWDIQAMLQKEWLFTCTCMRCQDETELGSYFSSLKCPYGGYFIQKISECQSVVCSKCNTSTDFTDRFKKIQAIESNLTSSTAQNIPEICNVVEEDEEIHDNFILKTKVYKKYVDIFENTDNQDILEDVVRRVKIVLNTLQLVDRGCSKLMGKYLMVLAECQQRMVKARKGEGGMSLKDLKQAVKELTMIKLTAVKMLSQYVII